MTLPEGGEIFNERWRNVVVRASCCGCDWRRADLTQGATVAAARRHVATSGHEVQLERTQVRHVLTVAQRNRQLGKTPA